MYQITGKTYDAREALSKAGYTYDAKLKAWIGSSREGFDALVAKWTKPGYGCSYDRMARAMKIEEIIEL